MLLLDNFSWVPQLYDVNYAVYYCTGGGVHITNKKTLLLKWCQQIDVYCLVHYSTQKGVKSPNSKI